jgi:uncharacterized protein (DUF58 family)
MPRIKLNQRVASWLENHWVTPSYSGWLLGSLSLFFFVAATNTMAGWLYVISSIGVALLAIAALLPERSLRGIQVQRRPIDPVSVGEPLTIKLRLKNATAQPKALLQVQDLLPYVLAEPAITAIESLAPHAEHTWIYAQPTQRRGIYRWHTVQLRTAAPLGLFWCRRSRLAEAKAIVYPTVLPLERCPLIDQIGRDASLQFNSDRRSQSATEGVTRSLRPYRWGDPTRLVHWRSSARYGELRVRELELLTGGQELIIGLDSAADWRSTPQDSSPESFEQAVIAAASLYFYAQNHSLNVQLWTASTGTIHGNTAVLEALAEVQSGVSDPAIHPEDLPPAPIVWLTPNSSRLDSLPSGSRYLLWTREETESDDRPPNFLTHLPGIPINSLQPLLTQLQTDLLPN